MLAGCSLLDHPRLFMESRNDDEAIVTVEACSAVEVELAVSSGVGGRGVNVVDRKVLPIGWPRGRSSRELP